jgi:hypothetical protein
LSFSVERTRRLEIVTPRLEYLYVSEDATYEARISAPMLTGLVWWCYATYDPDRHRFEDVGHHLRLLDVAEGSAAALLVQRFGAVEELKLGICISKVIPSNFFLLKVPLHSKS